MKLLGRVAVLGASIELGSWMLATYLRPRSWRYNLSDLYASGAPRPWLVMAGEAAFCVGLAALALGLRRALPASDHRMVGCGLLTLASVGSIAGALARNSCQESMPQCQGSTFATASDWVHGIGALAEILGIAGAALVLAATLPRAWAAYSAATGCAALVCLFVWTAVPYPWVGTAERVLALALVCWVAALGTQLATGRPFAGSSHKVAFASRGLRSKRRRTRDNSLLSRTPPATPPVRDAGSLRG
jgi:hypothetical protein